MRITRKRMNAHREIRMRTGLQQWTPRNKKYTQCELSDVWFAYHSDKENRGGKHQLEQHKQINSLVLLQNSSFTTPTARIYAAHEYLRENEMGGTGKKRYIDHSKTTRDRKKFDYKKCI